MPLTVFTGFPGFIGTRLLRQLLRDQGRRVAALVYPEPRLLERARAFAAEHEGRVEVIPGDIARPRLGLDDGTWERLAAEAHEVYHLAALYNLAAPKDLSYRVNVEGTRHILDLCERANALRKLVYVSTYVVSGDREGRILESELEMGQGFRNFYEETKFLAEVEVRRRAEKVPAIVIRPASIIGDSRSGEIDKYDGMYYMIAALARLEREGALGWRARLLGLGRATARFHIAPVDYLLASMGAIVSDPGSLGKTFHVLDPLELRVEEVRRLVFDRFGVKVPHLPVSAKMGRALLSLPGMVAWTRVVPQVFDYFEIASEYDMANTLAANARAGVSCPRLPTYIDTLIAYVRSHPEIPPALL